MANKIVSTCFVGLDRYLKGAKKSSLIYICAKPGMGIKTFSKAFTDDIEFSEIKGNYENFSSFLFYNGVYNFSNLHVSFFYQNF